MASDKEFDYKDMVFKAALLIGGMYLLSTLLDLTWTISMGL